MKYNGAFGIILDANTDVLEQLAGEASRNEKRFTAAWMVWQPDGGPPVMQLHEPTTIGKGSISFLVSLHMIGR